MHILIFAGGAGTRLWPLSRKASPKQFERLKDNQSTLQMAFDRVRGFGTDRIFVSTNDRYVDLVKEQLPELDVTHIFDEPAKRDLAAAIGLALLRLKHQGVTGTIAMLWSDHFMDHPDHFRDAVKRGEQLIMEDKNRFIFLAETPRFANHNLGWIHMGAPIGDGLHAFAGWKYRPDILRCQEMFESGEWMWNPGYFIFDIDFVLGLYAEHQPEMLQALEAMVVGTADLALEYPKLPAMSFDTAIVEKIDLSQAVVIKTDLGWSDPGTLYALKEALTASEEENYTHGSVLIEKTRDSFVHNEEGGKVVAAVGLDGLVVVNTKDVLLVCHKDHVPDIKTVVARLEAEGKETCL